MAIKPGYLRLDGVEACSDSILGCQYQLNAVPGSHHHGHHQKLSQVFWKVEKLINEGNLQRWVWLWQIEKAHSFWHFIKEILIELAVVIIFLLRNWAKMHSDYSATQVGFMACYYILSQCSWFPSEINQPLIPEMSLWLPLKDPI